MNTSGIIRSPEGINIASPERAFLDTLYLNKDFYFDNCSILDKEMIQKFLPIYNSKQLNIRVNKILNNA